MEILNRTFLFAFLLIFSTSQELHSTKKFAREGEAYIIKYPRKYAANGTTWYRLPNNESISSDKEKRVHAFGRYLWFLPTAENDTGLYSSVAQINSRYNRKTVNLTIYKSLPGHCFGQPVNIGIDRAKPPTEKIVCPEIDLYRKKSRLIWYKDCKQLHGSKYLMMGDDLTISEINKTDEGYYTCKFTYTRNGKEYNVSRTKQIKKVIEVSLAKFPIIETPRNGSMEVALGASINITCSAFLGYNDQSFHSVNWEINKTHIASSRFQQYKSILHKPTTETYGVSILTIFKVNKEDYNSIFTCSATNSKGWQESIITLKPPGLGHRSDIVVIFVLLGTVTGVVYILHAFFRVDIVLLYHEICKPSRSRDDGKVYDAYVIYPRSCPESVRDDSAEYFVNHILLDILENKCGYNLYVPGRNAIPGEDLASSSAINIEKSRRLIIVLTSSITCMESFYDQHIGFYTALISNTVKVIIITMDNNIELKETQESLRYILKQKGAIKWKNNSSNKLSPKSKFWKLVRYRMLR
ncbi:interleukin-1 receptor-like 1 [Ascaphus truei]|uniref:interleukin-1 receptor-like 1 n=1 Tax=Ascaphus truei TaxID=8439 RepID=UPI003F5961DD